MLIVVVIPPLLFSRTSIVQAWGGVNTSSDKCYVSIKLQKVLRSKRKKKKNEEKKIKVRKKRKEKEKNKERKMRRK
jgi:hypothetical protein